MLLRLLMGGARVLTLVMDPTKIRIRYLLGIFFTAVGHTDDRDHLFRSIATSVARVLTAPLDDGGDVSLLMAGQARREAVPVVNRRDPRVTRSALTAGAAARAGGPC